MNKIKEIVMAWGTALNPTEEQQEIAEIRLKTCMTCQFWTENAIGVQICRKCGCATKAKVFSPKGAAACPENKWVI